MIGFVQSGSCSYLRPLKSSQTIPLHHHLQWPSLLQKKEPSPMPPGRCCAPSSWVRGDALLLGWGIFWWTGISRVVVLKEKDVSHQYSVGKSNAALTDFLSPTWLAMQWKRPDTIALSMQGAAQVLLCLPGKELTFKNFELSKISFWWSTSLSRLSEPFHPAWTKRGDLGQDAEGSLLAEEVIPRLICSP